MRPSQSDWDKVYPPCRMPTFMAFVLTGVINASPQRVFAVLSDLNQASQWMPAIQKIDQVSAGSFGLGTTWRETRMAGKRTMESTIRVTSFDPPSALGLRVEGKAMTGQLRFALSPNGEGTMVHYEAEVRGKGLMRLMTGTINRMMAQSDADLIDRLKSRVERRI